MTQGGGGHLAELLQPVREFGVGLIADFCGFNGVDDGGVLGVVGVHAPVVKLSSVSGKFQAPLVKLSAVLGKFHAPVAKLSAVSGKFHAPVVKLSSVSGKFHPPLVKLSAVSGKFHAPLVKLNAPLEKFLAPETFGSSRACFSGNHMRPTVESLCGWIREIMVHRSFPSLFACSIPPPSYPQDAC